MNRQYGQNQTLNWVIGSPGHWVNFHVRVTGSSFWPGVRPGFFQSWKKIPKMQNIHLKCWNDKSHCQVSVVGLKSLDISPCNELLLLPMIIKNSLAWESFFTHKSTFGVPASPGQLGLRVAGFPGHWVTKCDPVPCLDTTGHTTSLVITVGDQENLAEYLVLCEYRIQQSFQALF